MEQLDLCADTDFAQFMQNAFTEFDKIDNGKSTKKKILTGRIIKKKISTKKANYSMFMNYDELFNVSKIQSEQLQNIKKSDDSKTLCLNKYNLNEKNIAPIIKANSPAIFQNELGSLSKQSNNVENMPVNVSLNTKTKQMEKSDSVQMPLLKPSVKLNGENIKMNTFPIRAVKALEWTINECFESDMDSNLFGEDKIEFESYIRDAFPNLVTRVMRRSDWVNIRSYIGKPRRFSAKYLENELNLRESKRHIIRYIHTHPIENIIRPEDLKYLPNELCLTLPVSTKVWVRLNRDIASGTVCGYDRETCQYKIKFDRKHLGERLIFDINVKSHNGGNMKFLHNMDQFHYNILKSNKKILEESVAYTNDLLHSIALTDIHTIIRADPVYLNGVPVKLLSAIIKMRKLLNAGQKVIKDLDEINNNLEQGKVMQNKDPKTESLIKQSHLALLKKCLKGVTEIMSKESSNMMLNEYESFSSLKISQEECERLLKKKVFKSEHITYLIKKFILLLCLMRSCEPTDISNGNLGYLIHEVIDEMELKITDRNWCLFRYDIVPATNKLVSIIEDENEF